MQRSVCTLIKFKLVLLRQQQYFRRVLLPPSPHIDTVEGKEFPACPHDRAPTPSLLPPEASSCMGNLVSIKTGQWFQNAGAFCA